MSTSEASAVGSRNKIVEKAKSTAILLKDSSYKEGGKDTSAFDCSYFVYLVMKEIFTDYGYMNSSAIASSALFKEAAKGSPGDIIFFPSGQVPYAVEKKGDKKIYPNHVGILLDSSTWVGRQSSSLATVLLSNPWWGSRPGIKYFTYCKIDAAVARANGSNLRKYFA